MRLRFGLELGSEFELGLEVRVRVGIRVEVGLGVRPTIYRLGIEPPLDELRLFKTRVSDKSLDQLARIERQLCTSS